LGFFLLGLTMAAVLYGLDGKWERCSMEGRDNGSGVVWREGTMVAV
jgi:hypothetical protein